MPGEIPRISSDKVPLISLIPSKKKALPPIASAVHSLSSVTPELAPHQPIHAKYVSGESKPEALPEAAERVKTSTWRSHVRAAPEEVMGISRQVKSKAEALVKSSLEAIQDFNTKVKVVVVLLMGLRSHTATALAMEILKQPWVSKIKDVPMQEQPEAAANFAKLQEKALKALHSLKSKKLIPSAVLILMQLRTESLSEILLKSLGKIFPPHKKVGAQADADLKIDAQKPLALPGKEEIQAVLEDNLKDDPIVKIFQNTVDVADNSSTPEVLLPEEIMDFSHINAEVREILRSYDLPISDEKPERGLEQITVAVDEQEAVNGQENVQSAIALGQELITEELTAKFLLGDEGMPFYHGSLDEEYAKHLLSQLPVNSALLFSERAKNDDLVFLVATRTVQGELELYEYAELSQGFDWLVGDLKTGVDMGIRLVGYDEAGTLMANRWVPTIPKEGIEDKQLLNVAGRAVAFKNNTEIVQLSTYFQGNVSEDEAETYFSRWRAPVGTALLRYDDSLGGYFISFVGVDAHNAAVIKHERVNDLAAAMQEHEGLAFVGNGFKAEEMLGTRAAYYWGQMEHGEAEAHLKDAPVGKAIIYARTKPDGRVNFFAGINQKAIDEHGNETVKFVSYDIGIRPDFDGSWVKFYAENPQVSLIDPAVLAIAKRLAGELDNSPYNHHQISNDQAEKMLNMANVGSIILHTSGEGDKGDFVFSVKLTENTCIHPAIPRGADFADELTLFLEQTGNLPSRPALPNSFGELFQRLGDQHFAFVPPGVPKKTPQKVSAVVIQKLRRNHSL